MSLIPSAPLKLARFPHSLAASLAALPSMSLIPFAPLYLGCSRSARPLPRGFTGHVARPNRSIETRSLPTLTRSYPRRFTFYVARPNRSIREHVTSQAR
jgi:hypothetical protein